MAKIGYISWEKMGSLILFVSIICAVLVLCEMADEDLIRIPIEVHAINGEVTVQHFQYAASEGRLEFAVANFCENFQIKKSFCRKLFTIAKEKQQAKQLEVRKAHAINDDIISQPESNFTQKLLKHPSIINAELHLYAASIGNSPTSEDVTVELEAMNKITSSLGIFSMSASDINRIIIIHSYTLVPSFEGDVLNGGNSILWSILSRLAEDKSLADTVYRTFVLNYGYPVPSSLQQSFPSVLFIQVSDSVLHLQLPSLGIVHRLSEQLVTNNLKMTQILYLTALGTEYLKPYQSIVDWREMLLHFMIDQHQSAYHLLASGEFDAFIVNQFDNQYMFWSTARHLARLTPLSLKDSSKIPKWISLSRSSTARFFIAHSSVVDHLHNIYPPFCYQRELLKTRRRDDVSLEEFQRVCQYPQPDLARPVVPADCFTGSSEADEELNEDRRECYYSSTDIASRRSYARCVGLEINCESL